MRSLRLEEPETGYPAAPEGLPVGGFTQGRCRVRFARTLQDLDAVLKLRFEVFNLELGEGLESSRRTGRDRDAFDAACHHLVVEDTAPGRLVGTYRMQTEEMASARRGFYSAGEFDLGGLPREVVSEAVEVGRACVAREYRNRLVLFLLWKGLAMYLTHNRKRYLFGCCSLTSQDPWVGVRALEQLAEDGHIHPRIRVSPLPGLECRGRGRPTVDRVSIPVLFRTYLRHGAKVCGPPAIDRDFKTIDFLVVLDTEALAPELRRLYF